MTQSVKPIIEAIHTLTSSMQEPAFMNQVEAVGSALLQKCRDGQTIFIAGNGGSWADADHFAGELRAQFEVPGRKALPALALPISLSTITAWGNDYEDGFLTAMQRDLEAMAKPGDILIAISTSGKAKNIRQALSWASEHKMVTIGISGNGPQSSEFIALTDYAITIPHDQTARIQEAYQIVIHILCTYIDQLQDSPHGA